MTIKGWYYLHANGDLIYKPHPDAAADIRDSDLARALWSVEHSDRLGAWSILVEASAAGANPVRIKELAAKWGCDDTDAAEYANRVGCKIVQDGNQWCATRQDFINLQVSPAGFGETALDAMVDLCRVLGYQPTKMWGASFADLLRAQEQQK